MARTTSGPQQISLHRVLAGWGEGTSEGNGGGNDATDGTATWIHTHYDQYFWDKPGGDFVESASATTSVDDIGFYTWGSAAVMVGDVQSWVDSTASNFGWIPIGNETEQRTSKRFDSSEMDAPAHWPLLTVSFTSPGDCNLPLASDLNNDCTVDFADFAIVASEGLAGRTPLQLAEQRGNTEIVGLLRNHGAK